MINNLPAQNRQNLQEMKESIIQHFADDERQFQSINKKLDNITSSMKIQQRERDNSHAAIREDYTQIRKDIERLSQKVSPVVKWFDNVTFNKKTIMWIFGFIGSVIGIAIGLKNLFFSH